MRVSLGIDVACRAAHQASLADERGTILWSGRKFRTTVTDLDSLWAMLPAETSTVTVIMEPTRNAWVGEPLRRVVKLRSNLVKRRTSVLARLDALLEILSPAWHTALGADLANKTPLRFLAVLPTEVGNGRHRIG